MSNAPAPIAVALDAMTRDQALVLARELQGQVWGFKVNDLLLDCGLEIIHALREFGHVFADPKLHDIPNTVHNGVKKLVQAGADLITVHASGGSEMLKAAAEASGASKILAVTVLTSLGEEETSNIYRRHVRETVLSFAHLAVDSQVPGIVCSPHELLMLGEDEASKGLLKVVPGIRPKSYGQQDDQTRVLGPAEAIAAGATLLVVGRPITGALDRKKALEEIVQELDLSTRVEH